jgi:hypothetical protein
LKCFFLNQVFDMNNIDVLLPLDIDDEEMTTEEIKRPDASRGIKFEKETVMTSLLIRMRVAKVATVIVSPFSLVDMSFFFARIDWVFWLMGGEQSKRAFSIKPPTYSDILDLDRQIKEIEDSLPHYYRLKFEDGEGSYWKIVPPSKHITANEMRT